jgi:hypothetical protein
LSAETGIVENGRQDPGRNGLFSIDDGFPGSRRLDGGHDRGAMIEVFQRFTQRCGRNSTFDAKRLF